MSLPTVTDSAGNKLEAAPVAIIASDAASVTLLDEGDATGEAIDWPGGSGMFVVNGTWDGANASLEWRSEPDDDENAGWFVLGPSVVLEDDGAVIFTLPRGQVRVAIAGAGTTSLTAGVKAI